MKRFLVVLVILAIAVPAAGCGSDASGAGAPMTTETVAARGTFPTVVEGVAIAERPERILSASATHTEILFSLGAGERVFATDDFSNYPAAAEDTIKVDAFNLSVEAVAALEPDLVILSYDPGDVMAGLETLDIPALLFDPPKSLDEAFDQYEVVAAAVGQVEEAGALIAALRERIDRVVATVPEAGDRPTYYYELDPSYYSITSATFVGGLLGMLGLENVADPADTEDYGYPQLGVEFLLGADPDYIFLADTRCCGESAATVAERPGWGTLSAVTAGRVIELDDDLASRWGPRLADLVEQIAVAVYGDGE